MKACALLVVCWSAVSAADPSQEMQLRLAMPLASYSPPGSAFAARVLGPVANGGAALLPPDTIVRGTVDKALSVGIGVRRERALLALRFDSCELPGGALVPCDVRLLAIDNAREAVLGNNRIQGILSAGCPHSWINGVWYKPAPALLQRSGGLTGAGGMLYARLAPGPAGAAIIMASQLILFSLPDPEIELPAGTELIARVSVPAGFVPAAHAPPEDAARSLDLPVELVDWLPEAPAVVTRPKGGGEADLINVALTGSRREVEQAFEAAGWSTAEPLNSRTFARTYNAFLSMNTYPTAPVSLLHYGNRAPDLVFQKSFNSLAKRHHIRLWMEERSGKTVWLGAATHDTAITFDWARTTITHQIDPEIDRERTKVGNDLEEAGCLAGFRTIDRPDQVRKPRDDNRVVTDGALLLARLRPCHARPEKAASLERPRLRVTTLLARKVVLGTRYYLSRGNYYYWGYRGMAWAYARARDYIANGQAAGAGGEPAGDATNAAFAGGVPVLHGFLGR